VVVGGGAVPSSSSVPAAIAWVLLLLPPLTLAGLLPLPQLSDQERGVEGHGGRRSHPGTASARRGCACFVGACAKVVSVGGYSQSPQAETKSNDDQDCPKPPREAP